MFKKSKQLIIFFVIVSTLLVVFTACNVLNPPGSEPTPTVTLNSATKDLYAGQQFKLEVTVNPEGTACEFSSSDPSVATVDGEGNVTAVGSGSAEITVTPTGGKAATCQVTVTDVHIVTTKNVNSADPSEGYGYYTKYDNDTFDNCELVDPGLHDAGTYYYTTDIFVDDNGTIYIGGYYADPNNGDTPCYWKKEKGDGSFTRIDLTNGGDECSTFSIFVKGGTVYLAGSCNGDSNACYWKDESGTQTLTVLDDVSSESCGYGIFVTDDGNVYIAGYVYTDAGNQACYWVNNSSTVVKLVPDDADLIESKAYEIYVKNDQVYSIGYHSSVVDKATLPLATLWSNQVGDTASITENTLVTDRFSYALSVYDAGATIYVGGTTANSTDTDGNPTDFEAWYWKNGDTDVTSSFDGTHHTACIGLGLHNDDIFMGGLYEDDSLNYYTAVIVNNTPIFLKDENGGNMTIGEGDIKGISIAVH